MVSNCCEGRGKYVGLFVGCLGEFVAGSVLGFNSYGDSIKTTFNYTQKELELQSSMLVFGGSFGILPGIFFDRFGPRLTSAAGLFIYVISFMLLWSAPKAVTFYSFNSWLMSVYFLFAGLGSVTAYMVCLNASLVNFKERDRIKISGILNVFYFISPLVFGKLYYFILGSHTSGEAVSKIMLIYALSSGIVSVLCIIFLQLYEENADEVLLDIIPFQEEKVIGTEGNSTPATDRYGSTADLSKGNSSNQRSDAEPQITPQLMSFKEVMTNLNFHLFTWSLVIVIAVVTYIINNITEIAFSLHLDKYNPQLIYILPLTMSIVCLLLAVTSDKIIQYLSIKNLIVGGTSLFLVPEILYIFFAPNIGVLIFATVLFGICSAINLAASPILISQIFHIDNIGRNWGIIIVLMGVMNFILQIIYGALYDAAKTNPKDLYCYGMHCLRTTFVICIVSTVGAVVAMVAFVLRT